MNIIFFSRRQGRARHFNLAHPLSLAALGVVALGILTAAFAVGLQLGERNGGRVSGTQALRDLLVKEHAEAQALTGQLHDRIDAIALRMGQVNAHVIRLDALGKRLTQMASISSDEFDFDSEPAVGGPDESLGAEGAPDASGTAEPIPDLAHMLQDLELRLEQRDVQLVALENVIISRELTEAIQPEGRPVQTGHISSYFGERQDPFTGHDAQHKGMDFTGRPGSQVVAVATGIVTFSDDRSGYGAMVEVNHGNGYVTRYGHNQRNLVNVGQTVTRGQPIALMGSTGRSTGPHVHFEVLKNGRQVNPRTFIGR